MACGKAERRGDRRLSVHDRRGDQKEARGRKVEGRGGEEARHQKCAPPRRVHCLRADSLPRDSAERPASEHSGGGRRPTTVEPTTKHSSAQMGTGWRGAKQGASETVGRPFTAVGPTTKARECRKAEEKEGGEGVKQRRAPPRRECCLQANPVPRDPADHAASDRRRNGRRPTTVQSTTKHVNVEKTRNRRGGRPNAAEGHSCRSGRPTTARGGYAYARRGEQESNGGQTGRGRGGAMGRQRSDGSITGWPGRQTAGGARNDSERRDAGATTDAAGRYDHAMERLERPARSAPVWGHRQYRLVLKTRLPHSVRMPHSPSIIPISCRRPISPAPLPEGPGAPLSSPPPKHHQSLSRLQP